MATCAHCSAVKLTERPCPKCGRMNNVGNPKPFTDAAKLENLRRGLADMTASNQGVHVAPDRTPRFRVVKTGQE